MTTPLPFPWQVDTGLSGDDLQSLIRQYDDAKQRAKEAGKAGQIGVRSAWKTLARDLAETIVSQIRDSEACQ